MAKELCSLEYWFLEKAFGNNSVVDLATWKKLNIENAKGPPLSNTVFIFTLFCADICLWENFHSVFGQSPPPENKASTLQQNIAAILIEKYFIIFKKKYWLKNIEVRYFLIVQHAASSLDFSNLITLLLSKTDKKLTNWTDRLSNIPKCTTSFGESPRSTYTVHRVTPKKLLLAFWGFRDVLLPSTFLPKQIQWPKTSIDQ